MATVGGGAALAPGSTGLLDAEGSLEFHRLYSAIQFLTNMVEEGGESPDLEVFGEGLAWGGCILIHALGQQSRFNVLDYSYQVTTKRRRRFLLDSCLLNRRLWSCLRSWSRSRISL